MCAPSGCRLRPHATGRELRTKVNPGTSMPTKKSNDPPFSNAPMPCGLKYAASFLPGGLKTFVQLAWLSTDERARDFARRWRELRPAERDETDFEEVCRQVAICDTELLGAVISTAFELGIDVLPVIGGISAMSRTLASLFHRALHSSPAREQACEAIEYFDRCFQPDCERRR
jgi:hypothetical protein